MSFRRQWRMYLKCDNISTELEALVEARSNGSIPSFITIVRCFFILTAASLDCVFSKLAACGTTPWPLLCIADVVHKAWKVVEGNWH